MGILMTFAPFIAFAVIDRLVGPTQGLFAALIVSVALLVRDWIIPEHTSRRFRHASITVAETHKSPLVKRVMCWI
jgi:hypothetical protein